MNLADARSRIDGIDRQIQELIAERAGWAHMVGKAKGPLKAAVEYYRPERESGSHRQPPTGCWPYFSEPQCVPIDVTRFCQDRAWRACGNSRHANQR